MTWLIIIGVILGVVAATIAGIWLIRRIRERRAEQGKGPIFPRRERK